MQLPDIYDAEDDKLLAAANELQNVKCSESADEHSRSILCVLSSVICVLLLVQMKNMEEWHKLLHFVRRYTSRRCRSNDLLRAILAEIDERKLSCGIAHAVRNLSEQLEVEQKATLANSISHFPTQQASVQNLGTYIPIPKDLGPENEFVQLRTNRDESCLAAVQNEANELRDCLAAPCERRSLSQVPLAASESISVSEPGKLSHRPKETDLVADVQVRALQAFQQERRQIAKARLAVVQSRKQTLSPSPHMRQENQDCSSASPPRKPAVPLFRKLYAKVQQSSSYHPQDLDEDVGASISNRDITSTCQESLNACKEEELQVGDPEQCLRGNAQHLAVQVERQTQICEAGRTGNAGNSAVPKAEVLKVVRSQREECKSQSEDCGSLAHNGHERLSGGSASCGDHRCGNKLETDSSLQLVPLPAAPGILIEIASDAGGCLGLSDEARDEAKDGARKEERNEANAPNVGRVAEGGDEEQCQQGGKEAKIEMLTCSSDEVTESWCSRRSSQHGLNILETLDDPLSGVVLQDCWFRLYSSRMSC
jgi:hypothetical protein